MDKQSFISSLKEKSGVDNISERSWDEMANLFLADFSDDANVTDESWTKPVNIVKTMSGQFRHDLSVSINDFKSQYDTESKKRQEKAIAEAVAAAKSEFEKLNKEPESPEQKDDIDAKIADAVSKSMATLLGEDSSIGKVLKQHTDFMQRMEQEKKDMAVDKIRQDLKSYLIDNRGADREAVVNLAIKEMEISDKSDIDKLHIEVEKKYEKLYKDFYGDSTDAPLGGTAGGSGTTNSLDAFLKRKDEDAKSREAAAKALESRFM